MDQLYNLGFLNPQFDLNSTAEWVMFQAPPSDRFSVENISDNNETSFVNVISAVISPRWIS